METNEILAGKKILVVDDEPDVLETLIDLLDMCRIDTASSFDEGKKMLENDEYDLAVLDIMGVDGFELLKISNQQKIPALMLTANALSRESLKRSAEEGAAYYAPKDKMVEIDSFAADVLHAIEKKKSPWEKWFSRLAGFYDNRFKGTQWRDQENEFWKKKIKSRFGI